MRTVRILAVAAALLCVVSASAAYARERNGNDILNENNGKSIAVVRVLDRGDGSFIVYVREGKQLIRVMLDAREILIYEDAPAGKPMTVDVGRWSGWSGWDKHVIHIHCPEEINPGGWRQKTGKNSYTNRQMEVVE